MAGHLVQGAGLPVMGGRAEMLRNPGFEPALAPLLHRSPRLFLNAPAVLEPRGAPQFTHQTAVIDGGDSHVYGVLRGRARAGARGDVEARIFCSRLEAELVSIAGHYLVSDQLPAEQRGSAVQIALVDGRLTIVQN